MRIELERTINGEKSREIADLQDRVGKHETVFGVVDVKYEFLDGWEFTPRIYQTRYVRGHQVTLDVEEAPSLQGGKKRKERKFMIYEEKKSAQNIAEGERIIFSAWISLLQTSSIEK